MHIKKYIEKIIEDGDRSEMEELSEMLEKAVCETKKYDENLYEEYKMNLYEMAYGCVLTDEMKREWVANMSPLAKWSEEEITSVVKEYDIDMPILSVYVIMNMFYSDMKKALGSGDDEESLKRYIQATKDWYYDSDATNTEEAKLYNYYKYIVR
jgi:hypothetical protein